jgi:hypothetical protein
MFQNYVRNSVVLHVISGKGGNRFSSKVLHTSTDALLLILENTKIYILRPSSGSLYLSLAKVTLMSKQSVKLRRYVLCGGVAACGNIECKF